jgi:hypothetical protein
MNLKEVIGKHSSVNEFADSLNAEVIKLGTENPDFIYNTAYRKLDAQCYYNGSAKSKSNVNIILGPECKGCIFGQALQNMGWDDDYEMKSDKTISALLADFGETSFNFYYLNPVQMNQDAGQSWGEAIFPLKERKNQNDYDKSKTSVHSC